MFLDEHLLVLPYNNNGREKINRTSDPNCYCSCKDWQVQDAIRYTTSELKYMHLLHLIHTLAEIKKGS